MTDNPHDPYRIDQPLTVEERQLLEFLQARNEGGSFFQAFEDAGIRIEHAGRGKLLLERWPPNKNAVVALLKRVLLPLSSQLYQQGYAQLAIGAAGLAFRLGVSALGPEHPGTLASCNNLALCLDALGRSVEALPLWEKTFANTERALGQQHPNTLTSRNNLALCLDALGRAAEALPLFEKTLAERERAPGPEHPDTLTSRNNLALCLESLGRVAEALPIYEKTLADTERVLGPDHPDTLGSRNNLATCLYSLGRMAEALPLYEKTLADRELILGPDHPRTLTSRSNIVECLRSLSRPAEALLLCEKTLADLERVLGPEHPATLRNRSTLAGCLDDLGRLAEALPLYEKTLADRERVLGPEHPVTLISRSNLACCLDDLGRAREALLHHESVLEVSTRLLGAEHPSTLSSRNNLAGCLDSLGYTTEALPHFNHVLESRKRVLGEGHPDTLTSQNNLAACLDSLGRAGEALAQWQALVKALQLRPQPGGSWLELLGSCANALAKHSRVGSLTDWPPLFGNLSTALLGVIDLESPEQLEAARAGVAQFYTTYLGLCLDQDRRDLIPQVLAARQGRKLAALVLDELEAASSSLDPNSLRGRFQALRLELRQLALGLRVVEGGLSQPGEPGQRTLDAESAIARQRHQMAAYKAKLDEYRAVRAELEQSDPDFAITAAALKPTLPELQARLGEGEGLLLLFEYSGQDGASDDGVSRLALLVTPTASVLLPLPAGELQQSATLAHTWGQRGNSRGGMRRAVVVEAPLAEVPDTEVPDTGATTDTLAGELTAAMHAGLWAPLAPHIAGLTRLHLVTHGGWHLLPVELGAPAGLELASYPGFIYYHRLRHQGQVPGSPLTAEQTTKSGPTLQPAPDQSLGLAVHAAEHDPKLEPIPFVKAEARLVEALWPGTVHPDPDLSAERPALATLRLAAHGQADEKDPARANVLLKDQTLDFQRILGARQHPSVVMLSACTVGRTSDDPDGEPLGLVGSFLLKGSRYVIAALQPVPDFYMPLLVTLFYQGWMNTGNPDAALAEAKRRLKTGEWYPDTEALIRTHYQPVLEQVLTAVSEQPKTDSWNDPLLRLTHSWPIPIPYRALHPDRDAHKLDDLRARIATATGRTDTAHTILDALCEERDRLPGCFVDTLSTWVRGFGTVSN